MLLVTATICQGCNCVGISVLLLLTIVITEIFSLGSFYIQADITQSFMTTTHHGYMRTTIGRLCNHSLICFFCEKYLINAKHMYPCSFVRAMILLQTVLQHFKEL